MMWIILRPLMFIYVSLWPWMYVTRVYAEISPEEILSRKGQGNVDIGFSALLDQSRRVSVIAGSLAVEEQETVQYTPTLGFAYGISSRIEMTGAIVGNFLRTVVRESDRSLVENTEQFEYASLGMNWLAVRESDYPAVLIGIEGIVVERDDFIFEGRSLHHENWLKSFVIGTSIYKQIDPVILLASLRYQAGLKRNVHEFLLLPGSAIAGNIMTIFAANERVSIAGGINVNAQSPSRVNGIQQGHRQTNVSWMSGIAMSLSPIWSASLSVQGGLTEAAPDAVMGVKLARLFGKKKNRINHEKEVMPEQDTK
jgi:hypothetical protein